MTSQKLCEMDVTFMPDKAPPNIRPTGTHILLLGTAAFWGSAFVFSKVAEDSVPPLVAAFLRFGLAALLGVAIILIRKLRDSNYRTTPKKAWFDTMVLGVVGVTGYNVFFFLGLALSQASDGSMIIPTMSPAITVILAALFLKDKFRIQQIIGLCVTLFGSMIFFSAVTLLRTANPHQRVLGDMLFLAAAVFWAVNTLLSKRTTSKTDPFLATTYAMVFGSIVLGLAALPQLLMVHWTVLGWRFWTDEGYLALLPSVLANWFYYLGVQRIGPARTSVYMYFVPVSSLILSALVLGETLTAAQFVGAILMMIGVWMINRRKRSTIPAPEVHGDLARSRRG